MKKLIGLVISLCIVMSLLTACSWKNSESASNFVASSSKASSSKVINLTKTQAAPIMATPADPAVSANTTANGISTLENVSSLEGKKKLYLKTSTKKVNKKSSKKSKKKKKKKKTPTGTPTPSPTPDPSVTKYVALTFDDGPNTVTTPQVLDKLEKYNIVASFFLIGLNLNDAVLPVMQRQLALGCEIDNHSWTHSYMNKMSKSGIIKEFKDTSDKIYSMVGVYPKFFRPPYIATSVEMYDNIDVPFICGLGCNDWDVSVTTKERADTIINNVKDGEIILLHDAIGNNQTVEALDTIIPTLQKWGYKFVTVSQLFEKEGIDPNPEYKIWTNVLE